MSEFPDSLRCYSFCRCRLGHQILASARSISHQQSHILLYALGVTNLWSRCGFCVPWEVRSASPAVIPASRGFFCKTDQHAGNLKVPCAPVTLNSVSLSLSITEIADNHLYDTWIMIAAMEREIRSKVNNEPAKVYKAGQNFSEMPGSVHGVSENASKTKPAKLLAVFVVDTSEKVLTSPTK